MSIEETTIALGLRVTDDSAGYDAACKRVLSEKSILARIMKACLEEYKDCDVNEIETYIEGSPQVSTVPVMPDEGGTVISGMDTEDKSVHEGTVTYDIRFRAIVPGTGERIGLIINLEAQNEYYPGYPLIMRGVFYCCRAISSQYGREFTNSHYEKIKKVYSIWICTNPPKHRANTITRYRLVEENLVGNAKEPVRHYDLLSVIMVCPYGIIRTNRKTLAMQRVDWFVLVLFPSEYEHITENPGNFKIYWTICFLLWSCAAQGKIKPTKGKPV